MRWKVVNLEKIRRIPVREVEFDLIGKGLTACSEEGSGEKWVRS